MNPAGSSRPVTLCLVICLLIMVSGISAAAADEDMVTVRGTGYPPIRAESAAQAHLMAKRAAVVDAYRNALSGRESSRTDPDVTYQGLSGFVKGMKVVEEEYLSDGGIRITAVVPKKKVRVRTKASGDRNNGAGPVGPDPVTRDEWYRIINNLVRIER